MSSNLRNLYTGHGGTGGLSKFSTGSVGDGIGLIGNRGEDFRSRTERVTDIKKKAGY